MISRNALPKSCWVALAALTLFAGDTLAAHRTNIVLVMADDLGWGDLGCFNSDSPIHTPHLDALAASGLKFNRFYAAAPVCSPTRGSCLTGRHPERYGITFANVGHILPEEITLPELLREHGYATGHFGKWHLGTLTTEFQDANRGGPRGKAHFAPPQHHGYDVCFVTESKVPTFDPMLKPPRAGQTAWDFIRDKSQAAAYGTRYWNERGAIVTENLEGDDSRVIMDRAVQFIEHSVADEKPFFAAVWFHAPHLPVVAGPEHVARYASERVHARNYFGCVTALDEQVGRLRETLRTLNVADDTMLWFCSDNGPEGNAQFPGSAGPLRGRKRSLYEGGIRVPGLLEWPAKVRAGRVTDVPAVTSDYLPTILDVLEIAFPDDRPLDGISLLPVIEGKLSERQRPIEFHSRNQRALIGQRYKLYTGNAGTTWELYDLVDDAGEQRDLAGTKPALVRDMSRQLEAWVNSCRESRDGADFR